MALRLTLNDKVSPRLMKLFGRGAKRFVIILSEPVIRCRFESHLGTINNKLSAKHFNKLYFNIASVDFINDQNSNTLLRQNRHWA